MNRHSIFARAAKKTADWSGRPLAFCIALAIVVVWGVTGPLFHYSDTWQLVINTGTTIVTFLMVFLIQNAQNRDTRALQVKLDELIRVTEGAHTALLDLEELEEHELHRILDRYQFLAAESRKRVAAGGEDIHVLELPAVMEEQLRRRHILRHKRAPKALPPSEEVLAPEADAAPHPVTTPV
jgi:low affinity Fe/Cu permease